jgi:hypothetical protein
MALIFVNWLLLLWAIVAFLLQPDIELLWVRVDALRWPADYE